jgi:hypothetical protein
MSLTAYGFGSMLAKVEVIATDEFAGWYRNLDE